MLKLLQSPASPFARKARVTVIETGLTKKVEDVGVAASPKVPNSTINDQNPLGKIPCLVLDDGSSLFDSRAITRYLDSISGSSLYPKDAWEVLTLEAMGDGVMDAAVAMIYEKRLRSPEMVFDDFIEWQWLKVARTLDALDQNWSEYLSEGLTAGHISVACALGYLDFRHSDRDWRAGRPNLAKWNAEFSSRPSMAQTAPADA